jgi:hypothetical protein
MHNQILLLGDDFIFSFFKAEKAEKYVDFGEKNGHILRNFKNKKLATFLQLVPIGSQNMKGFLNF